jgi:hypothetical protein
VACLDVEICKYINVRKSLCKMLGVKLRWHVCKLREFKLMILSEFYLYSYTSL